MFTQNSLQKDTTCDIMNKKFNEGKMKKIFKNLLIYTCIICMITTQVFATEIEEEVEVFDINSTAHMLIDMESGFVIEEKNSDRKIYPASTTKLMTALIVLENLELTDMVEVHEKSYDGVPDGASTAYLKVGEIMSVEDMLYCLLLPSANEAANAFAYHIGDGDYEVFTNMMNIKAITLGAYDTNFVNASGLHDDNHYTTASDMAKIARAIYEYEIIQDIFKTGARRLSATNLRDERVIYTTNYLVFRASDSRYYRYSLGGKTGYTSMAGNCLVSFAEKGGSKVMALVFGAKMVYGENQVFNESKILLEWGFNEFERKVMLDKSMPIHEVSVKLSSKSDYIALSPSESVSGLLPVGYDANGITYKFEVEDVVKAPIEKGSILGTVEVLYDGISYGKASLLAVNDVPVSNILVVVDVIENFFSSTTFYMLVVILFLVIIVASIDPRAKERRMRKKVASASRKRQR